MLENKIEELTKALNRVADALEGNNSTTVPAQQAAPAPQQPAPEPAPEPQQSQPAPAPQAAPAPQQQAPAPQQQAAAHQGDVPFSDASGLVQYTMKKYREYKESGTELEKGAKIQQVMKGLGYENINEIQPEHFVEYYNGVEAIQ